MNAQPSGSGQSEWSRLGVAPRASVENVRHGKKRLSVRRESVVIDEPRGSSGAARGREAAATPAAMTRQTFAIAPAEAANTARAAVAALMYSTVCKSKMFERMERF